MADFVDRTCRAEHRVNAQKIRVPAISRPGAIRISSVSRDARKEEKQGQTVSSEIVLFFLLLFFFTISRMRMTDAREFSLEIREDIESNVRRCDVPLRDP